MLRRRPGPTWSRKRTRIGGADAFRRFPRTEERAVCKPEDAPEETPRILLVQRDDLTLRIFALIKHSIRFLFQKFQLRRDNLYICTCAA